MFRICSSIVRAVVSTNPSQKTTSILNLVKCSPAIRSGIVADHHRSLRTSQCHQTPKLTVLLIRPIVAALSGRLFRQWWKKKNEAERKKYSNCLFRNKGRILSAIGLCFGSLVLYYYWKIEETPITEHKRFTASTNDQFKDINNSASASMTAGHQAKRDVKRVLGTAQRIVLPKCGIEQLKRIERKVSKLQKPGTVNAEVLVNGQKIVVKGIIKLCFIDNELISPTDVSVLIDGSWDDLVMNLRLNSLYLRDIKSEKDDFGSEKAKLPPGANIPPVFEYVSTHPTHEKRWKHMEKQLESTLMLREACKCKPLGPLPKEPSK